MVSKSSKKSKKPQKHLKTAKPSTNSRDRNHDASPLANDTLEAVNLTDSLNPTTLSSFNVDSEIKNIPENLPKIGSDFQKDDAKVLSENLAKFKAFEDEKKVGGDNPNNNDNVMVNPNINVPQMEPESFIPAGKVPQKDNPNINDSAINDPNPVISEKDNPINNEPQLGNPTKEDLQEDEVKAKVAEIIAGN